MKKLIIVLSIIIFVVIGLNNDIYLFAKKLFLDEPTTHKIEEGEYLSKIAKQYYGDADYWRELALINRAPNSDLVFPGEEIVLPSSETIQKIRNTRWLSKVNNYVKNQEEIIAGANEGEKQEKLAETLPAESTELIVSQQEKVDGAENTGTSDAGKASFPYLLVGFFVFVVVAATVVAYFYRRKKQEEAPTLVDDDDSEPDYNDYLNKKKEEEKEEEFVLN